MAIEIPRHAATFPTKTFASASHDEHGTKLADPGQSQATAACMSPTAPVQPTARAWATHLGQIGLRPISADRAGGAARSARRCPTKW